MMTLAVVVIVALREGAETPAYHTISTHCSFHYDLCTADTTGELLAAVLSAPVSNTEGALDEAMQVGLFPFK